MKKTLKDVIVELLGLLVVIAIPVFLVLLFARLYGDDTLSQILEAIKGLLG